jgi:hypothetical protein
VRDFTVLHANRLDKLAPAAVQRSIRVTLDVKEWDIISSRYNVQLDLPLSY